LADVNAEINVNIDTSGALAQLKSLQREISRFHTSVAKSSDQAALAQRDLQKNFINGVNAIRGFSAELRTVKTTAENFTTSLEKNKFSMREYFRYAGAATKTFGRMFSSELDTVNKVAVENVKRLQTQYVKMGRDATGAMRAIAIMPTQLDMSNLTTQTQLAAQKQAIFNQLVKQGSTNLLNFGKNTQWAGRQLMVGFTIPLMGLGSVATKTFMDMETAAIKFKKVYGDLFTAPEETQFALESIQMLGREFTKYGIAVADTVTLAAEAAAAGFSGSELQAQVTQATRLQVLGQVDQQKALETTISLSNAFGIAATDLADAINFLNSVENQTVVSLDDITTAIPKAAPVVKQLGGDVKDLAFFMAAMKEGGINASEGANALKSGLASLINPTNKARGMLKDFGIDIDGIVNKNAGNVKETVIEFAKALDGLSNLDRQRAIEQLFGKFQLARLSTLFDNVIRDGNQASRVLDLANASVEDLASLAEKELGITADSAMNKFRKSIEDLKVSLAPVGEVFLQIITPLLDKLNNLLEWFNGLSDTTKKTIAKVVLYLGGLGPVILMTIGLMANFVANGIKGLMLLRNGYLRLTGQSKILGEQTEYLSVEQQNAVAAAASLEQSHIKLQQAFTGEAGSVRQLISEYQRMIVAQDTAAARFPGMMQPGFKAKKYAKGIVSVPGPKGAGDVVPAMLSPGEAVIPAKMVEKYGGLINGMISDNIPGYKVGKYGAVPTGPDSRPAEYGHISVRVEQTLNEFLDQLLALPEELRAKRQTDINKLTGLQEVGLGDASVNTYSSLATWQSHKLNQAIKEGDRLVSIQDFMDDFDHFGTEMWLPALKDSGSSLQDVADELPAYHDQLRTKIATLKDSNGNPIEKITGRQYAALEREVRATLPAQSKLRIALDKAALMVDEYRINISAAQAEMVKANYPDRVVGEGTHQGISTYGAGGKEKGLTTKVRIKGERIKKKDVLGKVSLYEANLAGSDVAKAAVQGAAVGAGTASPSKKTIPIGEDIARGLQVGMLKQLDETVAVSKQLSSAVAGGLINPRTGRPFTEREIADLKRVRASDVKQMVGKSGQVAFLGMPGMPDDGRTPGDNAEKAGRKRTRRSATRAQGPAAIGPQAPAGAMMLPIVSQLTAKEKRRERMRAVRGSVSSGVGRVGGRVSRAGGGFGVSGLLFALSMLPGKFGQLAQSIMPAVFGLQALSMVTKIIGGWPTLLLAVGAGLYLFNKASIKAAEEVAEAAKIEAEARYGSIKSIEQFAEFTDRALPSAREFSRNNRQLIAASGEAVKRFAEFYGQKENRSTQEINAAAMRSPEAGMQAAAIDVAQRAAILGLSPADISANIKAAADLIGADQVKLKMAVQSILSPDGKDITKEPLTIKARMEFLRADSTKKIESITKAIETIGKINLPKTTGTILGEKFDYQSLKKAAGAQESINRSYSGGIGGDLMGAAKQAARLLPRVFGADGGIFGTPTADVLGEFKDLQSKVQSASTQLSVAFMQEKESLALLNAQYADGLITKEEYDAQFAISFENMDSLETATRKLVVELNKVDSSGELAASAVKDLGEQALATLKKSNPALFKKISDSLSKLEASAQIDIYMGYAKGSLTILDLAKIPDILSKIDGKTATVALKIIAESGLSSGAAGMLSAQVIQGQIDDVNELLKAGYNAELIKQRDQLYKDLAAAKKAEADAAKVNQKGSLDTDNPNKTTSTGGAGKFLNPYEKELAILKKKRDALKDINDELDRQNQYQMKQLDLINQAAKAKMTGDYLQAASLQQQSLLEGAKFTRESKIVQMDRIIDQAEERSGIVSETKKLTSVDQTLLKKLRAGNYGSIAALPTTPNVGFGAKPTGTATGANVGGAVYNVTMNVTGSNAEEISTKVLAKLKLMESKSNKTNKVPL